LDGILKLEAYEIRIMDWRALMGTMGPDIIGRYDCGDRK
jgi:hypothetical protein